MDTSTNKITVFEKLLRASIEDRITSETTSIKAMQWFKEKYPTLKPSDLTQREFLADKDRRRRNPLPGRLYMFLYKPKGKAILPYYDKFPLVFPFRKVEGGFFGLNMHYLSPIYRAKLMDGLYDTISGTTNLDENTKLKISYKILESASKYKWFKPCVKHYLTSHMASHLIYIEPNEWNLALFVPTEQFMKTKKTNVWQDSKRVVNGI